MARKNIEDILSLTPAQEGILFQYLKNPGSDHYFEQLSLSVSGALDRELFEQAWRIVIENNEMMRTLFRWKKIENPIQVTLKNYDFKIRYFDNKDIDIDREEIIQQIRTRDRQDKFDLEQVPFRVTLFKAGRDKHEIIISNHHILYDGWSSGIILNEFFSAYNALLAGKKSAQPVKTKFKEYIKWISGLDKTRQEIYWREYLCGFENAAELSIKRRGRKVNDTAQASARGKVEYDIDGGAGQDLNGSGSLSIELEKNLQTGLEAFVQDHKITIASLFYTAFGILLQRYNDSHDVVFGTTVSGRSAKVKGIENIVGLFINTLPLRVQGNPGLKTLTLIKEVNEALNIRKEYEATPLTDIKRYSTLDSSKELFDTLVVIENYPLNSGFNRLNSPLTINSYSLFEMTHYDLTIIISPAKDTRIDFLFNPGLLEKASIERLRQHMVNILGEIVRDPGKEVWALEMLSAAEKNELLFDFNRTAAKYMANKTIHGLFEEQADRNPGSTAVIAADGGTPAGLSAAHSYRQVHEESNRLSRLLMEKGVRGSGIAALLVDRSLAMIVGVLSILKAGGAYLPIDPDFPRQRVEYILADSGAKLLLTTRSQGREVEKLRSLEIEKVFIEECKSEPCVRHFNHPESDVGARRAVPSEPATCNLKPVKSPLNPAYIIYTSGSTGRPKGVIVEHRSVINLLYALQKKYPVDETDAYLLKTSYTFDVAVTELFGWYMAGGRLVILEKGGEKNPKKIIAAIEKTAVTHINFIPAMFNAFTSALTRDTIHKLASLRYIFLAGEALLPELVRKFRCFDTGIALENIYGPTEATVYACNFSLSRWQEEGNVPIGKPMQNMSIYILDKYNRLQPVGAAGELCLAGYGLARGYLNRPELTAEKFVKAQSFSIQPSQGIHMSHKSYKSYLYKTGDLACWLPDGNIEFLGRIDQQVKIRGFRVELGEIENQLLEHDLIKDAVVLAQEDKTGEKHLYAYIAAGSIDRETGSDDNELDTAGLRKFLSQTLPGYMVPAHFIRLETIPLTPAGKIDRRAVQNSGRKLGSGTAYVSPAGSLEKTIARIWQELLHVEKVGSHDNFFDAGGNSLSLMRLSSRLEEVLEKELPVVTLFKYPTVASLSRYIMNDYQDEILAKKSTKTTLQQHNRAIAVIGMACRFPGARSPAEFRDNLIAGIESISLLTPDELREKGVASELIDNTNFVPAKGRLPGFENFDSSFFDYTPAEAEVMDPQMRIFHEVCWEALEDGGYGSGTYPGRIGLYAGATSNPYWEIIPLKFAAGYSETWDAVQLSDKDYLSTRIGYKLDLKGPCVTIQTACSTSLVAIHLAYRGLVDDECDMALAGGVSLTFQDENGYLYQEGTIMSPDGCCRAFDARAKGTVGGNGAGAVLLKPLTDAISNRDHIYAVIKGSAVNNDGREKAGFTAPSVTGQAEAISTALEMAGFTPASISYIETHGTGTPLGDPIEIAGLKKAFKIQGPDYEKTCALGSVKTNIGHLDAAAGVAGFIKTVLAIEQRLLLPSLHFEAPNPQLDLEHSPFYVNTAVRDWHSDSYPLRAGISSFGLGGTNAHVVLEEWNGEKYKSPIKNNGKSERPGIMASPLASPQLTNLPTPELILLSAKIPAALDKMTRSLTSYLKEDKQKFLQGQQQKINSIADVAYTLQVGRKPFPDRRMLICSDWEDAVAKLSSGEFATHRVPDEKTTVIFMFSGQGSQYVNMGIGLYKMKEFRSQVDRCFAILERITGRDMKPVLYPGADGQTAEAEEKIFQFRYTTPIKLIFEYSLAKLLLSWGIRPHAMIGHSFGEYAAACLAGVFSLEDALFMAATRGELMHRLPAGVMLSVPLPEEELLPLLGEKISLAAVNGPSLCVVSGPEAAVAALEKKLNKKGHECIRFRVPKAGHSWMVEPIMAEFREKISRVVFKKPQIPFISGMSGRWIAEEEAVNPDYWTRHLREPVRFYAGLTTLFKEPNPVFLQVGPGRGLTLFVNQHPDKKPGTVALNLLKHRKEEIPDVYYTLNQVGLCWLYGTGIDWTALPGAAEKQRIPLPTYPFAEQVYRVPENLTKIEPVKSRAAAVLEKKPDIADWFYIPSWERTLIPKKVSRKDKKSLYLLFPDNAGVSACLEAELKARGHEVMIVKQAAAFARTAENVYEINPAANGDYEKLIAELKSGRRVPAVIVHCWGVGSGEEKARLVDEDLNPGFYSLLYLAKAIGSRDIQEDIRVKVVTSGLQEVTGVEELRPGLAAVLGPLKVIPQEMPNIRLQGIDIEIPVGEAEKKILAEKLSLELSLEEPESIVALRGRYRWQQAFKPLRLERVGSGRPPLRKQGVYLITGGLGAIGLVLARHLAKIPGVKLILTRRSPFPVRAEWPQWLASHDAADPVSLKITELQEIEKLGAEAVIYCADVSNRAEMEQVIRLTEEKFGPITGMIHAAGIIGERSFRTVKETGSEECRQQFIPKIYGLMVLAGLIKDKHLDFCLLMSSTSAVLGGLGFAAYAAANSFMDAFALQANRSGKTRWISVNWDGWQLPEQQVEDSPMGAVIKELAMTPDQGAEVFERVLAAGEIERVVQCSGDLQLRIDQWVELASLTGEAKSYRETGLQKRPPLQTPYEPPVTRIEQNLAGIWGKILGYDRIGTRDSFFELGGDSLKAVIVSARIQKEFLTKIPLKYFFAHATIAQLAVYINGARQSGYTAIKSIEKKEYYELSSSQRRMYILARMEKQGILYNIGTVKVLEGDLDAAKLEGTFARLIRRHEGLRTSFHIVDNLPVQRLQEEVYFELEEHTPAAAANQSIKKSIERFFRNFDLSAAPLARVGLIRLAQDRHLLLIDIHHIISDGTSLGILIREFAGLYAGNNLPELRIRYKDFSHWQNRVLSAPEIRQQEEYWLTEYSGKIPVLRLPRDYESPTGRDANFTGSMVCFEIDRTQLKEIHELAAKEESSLFMVLLTVFNILLLKLSGQEDIIVGTAVAGRSHPDLENIIGLFLNTLALRNFPAGHKMFRDLLREVRQRTLNAFENRDYPFDELVTKIIPGNLPGRRTLFQVMFGIQNMAAPEFSIPGLKLRDYSYHNGTSKFEMIMLGTEREEKLYFDIEYNTTLFKPGTIENFIRYFKRIISRVLANPEQKIAEISILSGQEENRIAAEIEQDHYNSDVEFDL